MLDLYQTFQGLEAAAAAEFGGVTFITCQPSNGFPATQVLVIKEMSGESKVVAKPFAVTVEGSEANPLTAIVSSWCGCPVSRMTDITLYRVGWMDVLYVGKVGTKYYCGSMVVTNNVVAKHVIPESEPEFVVRNVCSMLEIRRSPLELEVIRQTSIDMRIGLRGSASLPNNTKTTITTLSMLLRLCGKFKVGTRRRELKLFFSPIDHCNYSIRELLRDPKIFSKGMDCVDRGHSISAILADSIR